MAQDFQICHCEAPKGPWQSRSTRLDNRKVSGEYGIVTRRAVEVAVPYKACAVGDGAYQLAAAKGAR